MLPAPYRELHLFPCGLQRPHREMPRRPRKQACRRGFRLPRPTIVRATRRRFSASGDSPCAFAIIFGATCSHSVSPVAEHASTFVFAASRMRASGSGCAPGSCAAAGSAPARNKAASHVGENRMGRIGFHPEEFRVENKIRPTGIIEPVSRPGFDICSARLQATCAWPNAPEGGRYKYLRRLSLRANSTGHRSRGGFTKRGNALRGALFRKSPPVNSDVGEERIHDQGREIRISESS